MSDRRNEVSRQWEAEGRRHLHAPVSLFCRSTSQTDLCAGTGRGAPWVGVWAAGGRAVVSACTPAGTSAHLCVGTQTDAE